MKRLHVAGALALALTLSSCALVDLPSYEDMLDESKVREAIVAVGTPNVLDAAVSVSVDADVTVKVILTVDEAFFEAQSLCTVATVAVETVPFSVDRLSVGIHPADDGAAPLDARQFFDELGVTASEDPLDRAGVDWADAEALADRCS